MDNAEKNPDFQQEEDLYAREERCQKSIRTIAKAIVMRLAVVVLMIWVVISNAAEVWAWGLTAFVLLIDLTGMIPLWVELRKQQALLRELIAMEE